MNAATTSKQTKLLSYLASIGARFVMSTNCNVHVVYSNETVQQNVMAGWTEISGIEYMARVNELNNRRPTEWN